MTIDLTTEPLGTGTRRQAGVPARHLADRARDPGDDAARGQRRDVPRAVRGRVQRRRALAVAAGADRRSLRVGAGLDLHPQPAVLRGHDARSRRRSTDITGARALALLGDSITTDHISPAGSIKKDSPAGKYLIAHGVAAGRLQLLRRAPRQPRSDDARHVRQRPPAQPARAGHRRRLDAYQPDGDVMTIYDAAMKYKEAGVPLVVLAGKEYGSGSSRDWAAKGTLLLGVQRGHRRELRAHPSQQPGEHGRAAAAVRGGRDAASLGLTGTRELRHRRASPTA